MIPALVQVSFRTFGGLSVSMSCVTIISEVFSFALTEIGWICFRFIKNHRLRNHNFETDNILEMKPIAKV